jgi:3-dehydrotetronate 4-kinase
MALPTPTGFMNSRLVFAAVADDDTGAGDLAGMLAEQSLRTLLVIDLPAVKKFLEWSEGYHAVVMAEGTRNLPAQAARERTREAIRILTARQPRVFQIKYCSTFDSTPEGNIGPTIDAAMDELGEDFTIALPALPVNGRTTYGGYHFVNGQLLSDSPMRSHPLTPMTNPNLVDLLGRQTKRRVGLASYSEVEAGADGLKRSFESLRGEGVSIALVDCLNDEHLETICRAAADLRLVTGSSAFGIKMPAVWRERGLLAAQTEKREAAGSQTLRYGCLIVAGSCSVATRAQNEWLAAQGVQVVRLDPMELLEDNFKRSSVAAKARSQTAGGRHCLLTTTDEPEQVRRVQEWGAGRGLTAPALGQAIAYALANLVLEALEEERVGGLIVAGGETSGALCRRLELGALRVGRNIEPGVPLCLSLGRFRLPLVLKSGNFGSRDFYGKALRAIERPAPYMI